MRLYSTPSFNDCELNYIEYYWEALKRHTRENCKYSFAELETTIFDATESVVLRTIRQFVDRSKKWMVSYINGLTEEQRNYTERRYISHTGVNIERFLYNEHYISLGLGARYLARC